MIGYDVFNFLNFAGSPRAKIFVVVIVKLVYRGSLNKDVFFGNEVYYFIEVNIIQNFSVVLDNYVIVDPTVARSIVIIVDKVVINGNFKVACNTLLLTIEHLYGQNKTT